MTRGRNLDELAKEQGFLGATNLVRFPASTVTTHERDYNALASQQV